MSKSTSRPSMKSLRVLPLTPKRWDDFVELFGPRGACEGCWCMTPRLPRAVYVKQRGAANRRAMQRLVDGGVEPGLIAYVDKEPVAWCSLGPREDFKRLERSRIAKPIDDQPTWSIVCFFVKKDQRGRGLSEQLVEAAAKYARSHGARLLEAYPIDPKKNKPMPAVFAWTGIASAFRKCGFEEVARRAPTRPILRRKLAAKKT